MHKTIAPHFRYFSHGIKKEISELYAAVTIADFAIAMVSLFEPIYFITVLGWSLTKVFLFFAGVYFFYSLLIPLGAIVASKKGYEKAVIYNIPFQIGYWLLLFSLPFYPFLAPLAAFVFALQKMFFWPAFHADLARFSDPDQRARESSVAWSIMQVTFIIGPFIGGLISDNFGLRILLIVSSLVYFTMFIPMLISPEKAEKKPYQFKDTLAYYKKFPRETLVYASFAEELITTVAWPVFIFAVVPSFFRLGLLVSVATLLATLIMLYAGKRADKGEGRPILKAGVGFSVLVWLSRTIINSLPIVFIADTFLRIGRNLFYVPLTTHIYNRANEEKILPYVVFFEQALSVGKLAACLLSALIFHFTGSFGLIFALAAVFTLLYLFLPKPKTVRLSTAV